MSNSVLISSFSDLNMLGTRFIAKRIRKEIEHALIEHNSIYLDFTGISVTQSFIDELLGPLALREGPDMLDRVGFKGCTSNVQAVIEYVLSSRLNDYAVNLNRGTHEQGLLEA